MLQSRELSPGEHSEFSRAFIEALANLLKRRLNRVAFRNRARVKLPGRDR